MNGRETRTGLDFWLIRVGVIPIFVSPRIQNARLVQETAQGQEAHSQTTSEHGRVDPIGLYRPDAPRKSLPQDPLRSELVCGVPEFRSINSGRHMIAGLRCTRGYATELHNSIIQQFRKRARC